MWNVFIHTFLSICSCLFIFLCILTNSTIILLLNIIFIIFIQGLNLLLLGINIFSIYLIIIYIGAIVILFSFMILFINWIEEKNQIGFKKKIIISLFYFFFIHLIFIFWLKIQRNGLENYFRVYDLNNFFLNFSFDSMKNIGLILYNEYIFPIIFLICILFLGLILVIKLFFF